MHISFSQIFNALPADAFKISEKIKTLVVCFYFSLIIYLIFMTGFWLRLSHLIPLLLPLAFLDGRPRVFLIQWSPFYLIILLYDSFRGFSENLAQRIDLVSLIHWEKLLFFGQIPTVWIQQHFLDLLCGWPGRILSIFYIGHFILPVIFLYWMWRKNERAFLCVVTCVSVLTVAAFCTFYLFPAAPPWMASQKGLLPPLQKVIMAHIQSLSGYLPKIYLHMNSNPMAPFPSLHAAYPMLWLLIGRKYFPKKVTPFLWINVLGVSLGIVSFAEHYVIDVFAGWFYAAASFLVAEQIALPALLKRGILKFALRSEKPA
jgi:hypothetical protein